MKGKVAADGGEEGIEIGGALGRDDLPCFQIGIIHAFLRVFQIPQNPVCQSPEPSAVGRIGFGNGRFISGPEQADDFLVIQERSHPFNLVLTLVVREIFFRVTCFAKKLRALPGIMQKSGASTAAAPGWCDISEKCNGY